MLRLAAAAALLPGRLGAQRRARHRRRRHDRRASSRDADTDGIASRLAGPGRAGDAEPALARVPARARRPHRPHVAGARRQLLDVAAGDVRVPGSRRRRRVRGDRGAGLRRNGQGRVRVGRGIPLRASRPGGQAVRRSRRNSRWRIVAAARTAGLGLTLLPVFYAHAGFGGTPTTAGQRRFVHTTYTFTHLYDRLRERRAEHGYVLGVAPHSLRAVTPEELGAGGPAGGAGRAGAHPRGRADAGSRRLLRVEPHAAGRMAAHAGERRCALVHRARDAHDREGSHRRSPRAARWPAWRRRPRPTWATARFRAPPISPPAAASASAAIRTRSSTVRGAAPVRVVAADARAPAQRAAATRATCRSARRCGPRAARGGAQALAQPVGAIEAGRRADLVVLERRRSGAGRAGAGRRPRRRDLRPRAHAGARRHGRRHAGSSATADTRRRTRSSPAIARRLRGWMRRA